MRVYTMNYNKLVSGQIEMEVSQQKVISGENARTKTLFCVMGRNRGCHYVQFKSTQIGLLSQVTYTAGKYGMKTTQSNNEGH